jgi:TPR repeat protein
MPRTFSILFGAVVVCSLNAQASHTNSPSSSVGFDLNGTWEASYGTPGSAGYRVEKILVFHLRNSIQAVNIGGRRYIRPADRFMTAQYPPATSLPARIPAQVLALQSADPSKLLWYNTTLSVDDADHFRIADIVKYHRTSTRQVHDVACEDGNPQHVSDDEAFWRGNAFFELKDITRADCWYRIGAIEGDARAQASYAYALLNGRGVKQDLSEARVWAEKSAGQHNAYGEATLAVIYTRIGFALGMGQSEELMKRYKEHDPNLPYLGDQTPGRMPATPVFIKDNKFTYDLSGEWKLIFPPNAPHHPLLTVMVIQKDGNFQMIVGDPNILYPIGESMFNGHYSGGATAITGDLMDAPARHSDGYRGYAWTKAEMRIVNVDSLMLPGGIKMKRVDELGANKVCDPIKYGHIDPARTFIYASRDLELHNYGNAPCWMYVSASQGHHEAELDLALFLRVGTGMQKDYEQSFIWLRKSADHGNKNAERLIAHCYELGIGVNKDSAVANQWLDLANDHVSEPELPKTNEEVVFSIIKDYEAWVCATPTYDTHQRLVADYEARMGHNKAETRVMEEEAEEGFVCNLMRGYQPPPMPGSH